MWSLWCHLFSVFSLFSHLSTLLEEITLFLGWLKEKHESLHHVIRDAGSHESHFSLMTVYIRENAEGSMAHLFTITQTCCYARSARKKKKRQHLFSPEAGMWVCKTVKDVLPFKVEIKHSLWLICCWVIYVYLPDLIKFQCPLAAPLKMSAFGLQGRDHKTAETLLCDEIWICKTRLKLTPRKEKNVRHCFQTDIIRKKEAFIGRRRGGDEMSFYMTHITAFRQRNRSLSPSPRTFCTCKHFLYAPSSATSFLPQCCMSDCWSCVFSLPFSCWTLTYVLIKCECVWLCLVKAWINQVQVYMSLPVYRDIIECASHRRLF